MSSSWKELPPKEQALHPDTPPDVLRYLSHFHPWEVLQNPVLPLLFLENPFEAAELTLTAQKNFIDQTLSELLPVSSMRQRRLWLCDCVERLFPHIEAHYPGEHAPQEAISIARAFEEGKATISALLAASAAANQAQHAQEKEQSDLDMAGHVRYRRFYYSQVSALCARVAMRTLSPGEAKDIANDILACTEKIAIVDPDDRSEETLQRLLKARVEEGLWQAERLREVMGRI